MWKLVTSTIQCSWLIGSPRSICNPKRTAWPKNLLTMKRALLTAVAILFLVAIIPPDRDLAAQETFPDADKALFIFDLAENIDYGESLRDSSVFRIGVLDVHASLFWAMGELSRTRTHIQGKPVELTLFRRERDITHTQVLFVDKSSGFDMRRIMSALGERQTMLITHGYDFHESMINFIVLDGQPRFDVNEDRIEARGMIVDNQVIAQAVRTRADWEELYDEAREAVEAQRIIIEEQRAMIEAQVALLDSLDSEISSREAELAEKQAELDRQLARIERQGREITVQQRTIETQQEEVTEQQQVLNNQRDEIRSQRSEIESQMELLDQQMMKIEGQEERIRMQLATLEKQRLVLYFILFVLLLSLFLAYYIYRGYRIKREANIRLEEKNRTISAQKDEIERQRDIAAMQRDQIAYQKKHITDSILYAKRIQTALLPSLELFSDELEHFVFFKPLDIVSGDFYWVHRMEQQQLIIAADCTGHGVPGAFMSMLGVSMLNEIVLAREITKPDLIINELRSEIVAALKQSIDDDTVKDGMDMAVCLLDFRSFTLYFAGANNPLYLIRDGELIHYRPDKMPVSIHYNMDPFTMQKIELKKGDCFYIFSDGFADQFGGPAGKKYMAKQFKRTLMEIADKPMLKQGELLGELFENWRGDSDQVDDVTVIGVRY